MSGATDKDDDADWSLKEDAFLYYSAGYIFRKNLRTLHISTRPHSRFRKKSCVNV